jgi:iron complex outermembrane recepter protein
MNTLGTSLAPTINRTARALGAALLVYPFLTATFAQNTDPAAASGQATGNTTVQLEKFEVTGSSIKRIDAETALPILTLNLSDIQMTGVSSSEQLLKTVSVTATLGAQEVSNTGAGGGQGGGNSVSLISLRGLGANRTLTLINGRRAATAGVNGVDVASIPLAALDHVEVLKDGASAIYGSDAVAGVVNFILRKEFTGTEVSATIGAPTRAGGGTEKRGSIYTGFGDMARDHYAITFAVSYADTQPIFGNTRTFARNIDIGNQLDKTSNTPFPANIRLNSGVIVGPTYPNCGPTSFTSPFFPNQCRYDNAPYIALQPQSKLLNLFATSRYRLSNAVEVYFEPSYTRNNTLNTTQHVLINGAALPAGAPYIATMTAFINSQPANIAAALKPLIGSGWAFLPSTSPYYPTAWVATQPNLIAGQPLPLLFRSFPTGVRKTRDIEDNMRYVAGVRGDVSGWDYDAYMLYGSNRIKDSLAQGWPLFDSYLNLINTGVINPFGPTTDQSAVDRAVATNYNGIWNTTATSVTSANAKVSRELFKVPAGMVSAALGGELRHENYDVNPAAANRNFLVAGFGGAGVPIAAARNVSAAYLEADVPLVKDVTLLKAVEVDAAVRYDKYERVGNTTNPKASLRWQPFQNLLLRGAAGSGYRAPTLLELFQPLAHGITTNGSRDLIRCPPGTSGIQDCSNQFVTNTGGNPNLQPEKSLSTSGGLTYEPTKNYSLSIDYWRISVTDIIRQALSTAVILSDPVKYSSFIHRGPGDAVSQQFGPIIGIDQGLVNLGKTNINGWDVDFIARRSFAGSNRLSARLTGTYLSRYDQQQTSGVYTSAINQPAALGIGVALRWRHNASLSWSHGAWSATAMQNYQVGYHDLRTSLQTVANTPVPRMVAPYETYDGQVSYTGIKQLRLTLGVKNILDRDPPYTNYGAGFVGGYDLSYSDVRGRFVYVTATYSFKGK